MTKNSQFVDVDSGVILIGDPAYLREFFASKCADVTPEQPGGNILVKHEGEARGASYSTSDGSYAVEETRNADGDIVAITIHLDPPISGIGLED